MCCGGGSSNSVIMAEGGGSMMQRKQQLNPAGQFDAQRIDFLNRVGAIEASINDVEEHIHRPAGWRDILTNFSSSLVSEGVQLARENLKHFQRQNDQAQLSLPQPLRADLFPFNRTFKSTPGRARRVIVDGVVDFLKSRQQEKLETSKLLLTKKANMLNALLGKEGEGQGLLDQLHAALQDLLKHSDSQENHPEGQQAWRLLIGLREMVSAPESYLNVLARVWQEPFSLESLKEAMEALYPVAHNSHLLSPLAVSEQDFRLDQFTGLDDHHLALLEKMREGFWLSEFGGVIFSADQLSAVAETMRSCRRGALDIRWIGDAYPDAVLQVVKETLRGEEFGTEYLVACIQDAIKDIESVSREMALSSPDKTRECLIAYKDPMKINDKAIQAIQRMLLENFPSPKERQEIQQALSGKALSPKALDDPLLKRLSTENPQVYKMLASILVRQDHLRSEQKLIALHGIPATFSRREVKDVVKEVLSQRSIRAGAPRY
jgi:hypothetical protein